jgi:hypothetical protein
MLVSNEAPSVQVGCYTSEAEREAARAATLEYWTNKIAGLEAELKLVEDAEILPVLAVAAPPRDEYSTQEAYDAEVARLQASFEQDKEREQTEIKSKADRIADLNSSIDAAKSARDAEVKTIDDASLCVGDPGTGAGTNENPSTRMPCASSAAADLVMSSDPYKLTIRICDEASKLSVQNYDISYNTLSAGEVMLVPGTARTYVVDVAVSTSTLLSSWSTDRTSPPRIRTIPARPLSSISVAVKRRLMVGHRVTEEHRAMAERMICPLTMRELSIQLPSQHCRLSVQKVCCSIFKRDLTQTNQSQRTSSWLVASRCLATWQLLS